MMTVNMNNS